MRAAGRDGGRATAPPGSLACYPTDNVAASARVYEVEPRGLLRADRAAEAAGRQLIGVYHSHTHTEAQPSPTDIAQAPDPDWHYVLVSLRDVHPERAQLADPRREDQQRSPSFYNGDKRSRILQRIRPTDLGDAGARRRPFAHHPAPRGRRPGHRRGRGGHRR